MMSSKNYDGAGLYLDVVEAMAENLINMGTTVKGLVQQARLYQEATSFNNLQDVITEIEAVLHG